MKKLRFLLLICLLLAAAALVPVQTNAASDARQQRGWVKEKKKTYYYNKQGKALKGWWKLSKKWYYFDKKTKTLCRNGIAGNKKDGFYYVDHEGIRTDDKTMNTAVKFIAQHAKAAASPKAKLLACYDYFTDKCGYVNHGYKVTPEQLPKFGMTFMLTDRGNCFMGSSAMCYCAKALGYETRFGIGNSYMGPNAHGWAEVKVGGTWYLFDINRTRWFKKKNFRMVTYDKYPVRLVRSKCYYLTVKDGKVEWKKGKFTD